MAVEVAVGDGFEVGDDAGGIEAKAAVISRLPQLEIYLHLFAA